MVSRFTHTVDSSLSYERARRWRRLSRSGSKRMSTSMPEVLDRSPTLRQLGERHKLVGRGDSSVIQRRDALIWDPQIARFPPFVFPYFFFQVDHYRPNGFDD